MVKLHKIILTWNDIAYNIILYGIILVVESQIPKNREPLENYRYDEWLTMLALKMGLLSRTRAILKASYYAAITLLINCL